MFTLFLLLSFLKLLFIPAYRSTDFEVHRNWLAITNSLPLQKWYYENTSEWTLDYPPGFAYFEYLLSLVAKYFDPDMLKVQNLNYDSPNTILFQRLSVIFTDVVYYLGVRECLNSIKKTEKSGLAAYILLLGNVGLLFVDHIHFQYNGILFGILLLSIGKLLQKKHIQSGLYFALLLNMKHIFIYMAPVYFFYLLKFYCFDKSFKMFLVKLIKIGVAVFGVTILCFGPFVDHLPQVLSRLFPFKRGLSHAYWAPNFWALYNFADKVLSVFYKTKNLSSNTGGLVQTFDHAVLPSITPLVTFILTAVMMVPCLIKLCFANTTKPTPQQFIRPLSICAATSFMFGWHVHEKAILMIIIPLSLLAISNIDDAGATFFISAVGHFSLFPLLFNDELLFIKLSMYLIYTTVSYICIRSIFKSNILKAYEIVYLLGLALVFLYEHVFQYILKFDQKLPFLPLMLTSVYCSIGVSFFWLKYYINYLRSPNMERIKDS